jgi:Protein of unknown function (DUF2793)
MDDTPNLKLPYIMAAQAQKHVTHNEAIRALDAIVQIAAADRDLAAPPSSPAEGDCYIVAAGATGAWAGSDAKIAAWQDGAWLFYAPREGWLAWVADEDILVVWDGAAWAAAGTGGATFLDLTDTPADYAGAAGRIAIVKSDETGLELGEEVGLLGVNATPDATNKLAIASDASLFNHAGAGHQHKINKNAAGDTASLLFQTGFSGRAEFGTAGDDDWHVKVSPDGSTWHEAIVVDKDTGRIGAGTAVPGRRLDILDGANPQLRLTNTDGVDFADLETGSDGNLSIFPSGNGVRVYVDNAGGEASGALATIEQDGAGDTLLQWLLTATRSWFAGIDNSDADKWKLASSTGTPNFGTDTLVAVTTGGGVTASAYLRVGSQSAPANTTAGDLTVQRLMLGTNSGFNDGLGLFASFNGALTKTTSGSTIGVGVIVQLQPASNSAADFRVLNMECQPNAVGINFSQFQAGYFINRVINSGSISGAYGVIGTGVFLGSSSATMGTVAKTAGGRFNAVTSFSNALTSTVTAGYGILIDNSSNTGSGPLTITGISGLAIDEQTVAANNTNLLLGTTAIPSGNFGLYSASTRASYFAGNVGIGTASPSTNLHVNGPARVGSYTVAGVPSASTAGAGAIIYVSNESGGAVLAFSDGTNWRRVTDRAVIS